MFLLPIKLHRVSFETMGRQNLKKTADFLIESIVFCPLVPPSWISLVDPTSAMYASATLRSINISGDRARIPSPVNDLSPKTWRFVTRFTSQS